MGAPVPSLFPGMDPYLEGSGLWPDFHTRFIAACADLLLDRLPTNYDARIDERVQLVTWSGEPPRRFVPDVGVTRGPHSAGIVSSAGGVATPISTRNSLLRAARDRPF